MSTFMLTPMMVLLHGDKGFNHFTTKLNFIAIEILKATSKKNIYLIYIIFFPDNTYIDAQYFQFTIYIFAALFHLLDITHKWFGQKPTK